MFHEEPTDEESTPIRPLPPGVQLDGLTPEEEAAVRALHDRHQEVVSRGTYDVGQCELLRQEVKYLGHVVSREGIAVDEEKMAAPLHAPTGGSAGKQAGKARAFNWGEEEDHAFMYNTTPHKATGVCPYFLMFGRQPSIPIDHLLDRLDGNWNEGIHSATRTGNPERHTKWLLIDCARQQ